MIGLCFQRPATILFISPPNKDQVQQMLGNSSVNLSISADNADTLKQSASLAADFAQQGSWELWRLTALDSNWNEIKVCRIGGLSLILTHQRKKKKMKRKIFSKISFIVILIEFSMLCLSSPIDDGTFISDERRMTRRQDLFHEPRKLETPQFTGLDTKRQSRGVEGAAADPSFILSKFLYHMANLPSA